MTIVFANRLLFDLFTAIVGKKKISARVLVISCAVSPPTRRSRIGGLERRYGSDRRDNVATLKLVAKGE